MIRLGIRDPHGKAVLVVGLTPENLRRLEAGEPIRSSAETLKPVAGDPEPFVFTELVLFFADRDACIELARSLGIATDELLAQLREGP